MPDREKVIRGLESLRDVCNAKADMAIGEGRTAWAGYASVAHLALALLREQEPVGGWISVKDRMPEAGKHVLADCEIRLISGRKKHYVCEAYYAPTHTIIAGSFPDDDECYEYDEEDDKYYLLEGWYECVHNLDDYSSIVIDDFVTHWMPLPEPPKEVSGNAGPGESDPRPGVLQQDRTGALSGRV